jgi:Cu2+-exporting ATPase
MLTNNGLTQFYRFREQPSNRPEQLVPQELLDIEALDTPAIVDNISQLNPEKHRKIELGLEGITCAACGWLIEKSLSKMNSVINITVNVTTQRATLVWDKSKKLSDIIIRLNKLGYRAYPFSEDAREKAFIQTSKNYTKRLLIAGLGMMQVMTYALAIYIGEFQDLQQQHQTFLYWISGLIATPVVLYSAKPFFISALNGLRVGQFGMNLPVSIAILTAYCASIYSLFFDGHSFYFDSVVMFTFFLLIGRFFEHRARYRSILKQQNFKQLIPLSVSRLNQSGELETIAATEINCGDQLIINAGSIIPVDGVLLEKKAEINEAVLTGEFLPLLKLPGDDLTSGSTNNSASLIMRVTKPLQDSHIQQLIQLQKSAEEVKPTSVSLADKVAHWYILILFLILLMVGLYWWNTEPEQLFPILLSVLVVSCPCALSLATPAAIATATAELSELGLMIRSTDALAKLAKIQKVFLDKTGTLTEATMQLSDTQTYSNLNVDECLLIAQSLEVISSHPIAAAFRRVDTIKPVGEWNTRDITESIGSGICGTINNRKYFLGNSLYVEETIGTSIINEASPLTDKGQTVLYLADQVELIACFTLNDKIKPSANKLIKSLNGLNIDTCLLSGDSQQAVSAVAEEVSIKHYIFAATPERKVLEVRHSEDAGERCLMVGDGFNDVGALASATASICMGAGVDLSRTSSDAVLLSRNLDIIARAISLSKKTIIVIRQNLAWAIVYNLLAIPFAAAGWIPAWLAAIGMSSSSLIVVINALRLRRRPQ